MKNETSDGTMHRRTRHEENDAATPNMKQRYWYGFARGYQHGQTGNEGRCCHTLSEFQFNGNPPNNWYSNNNLCIWEGICVKNGNICSISIPDTGFTHLPDSIGLLTSLRSLNVNDNQLTKLPELSILQKSLWWLDALRNMLSREEIMFIRHNRGTHCFQI